MGKKKKNQSDLLTQAYVMAVDIHLNIEKSETNDWKTSSDNNVIYMKIAT